MASNGKMNGILALKKFVLIERSVMSIVYRYEISNK